MKLFLISFLCDLKKIFFLSKFEWKNILNISTSTHNGESIEWNIWNIPSSSYIILPHAFQSCTLGIESYESRILKGMGKFKILHAKRKRITPLFWMTSESLRKEGVVLDRKVLVIFHKFTCNMIIIIMEYPLYLFHYICFTNTYVINSSLYSKHTRLDPKMNLLVSPSPSMSCMVISWILASFCDR